MVLCILIAEFKNAKVRAQQDDMLDNSPFSVKKATFSSLHVLGVTSLAVELEAVNGEFL